MEETAEDYNEGDEGDIMMEAEDDDDVLMELVEDSDEENLVSCSSDDKTLHYWALEALFLDLNNPKSIHIQAPVLQDSVGFRTVREWHRDLTWSLMFIFCLS